MQNDCLLASIKYIDLLDFMMDDGTRYLVLFDSGKYDVIQNRITYLISQKSGITYVFSHNYARSTFIHMMFAKYYLVLLTTLNKFLIERKMSV